MSPDLTSLLSIALQAIEIGEAHVRSHPPTGITPKGDRDVITDVDLAVERMLGEFLAQVTPAIGFLGEEHGGADAQTRWMLDPLDGTVNFTRSHPWPADTSRCAMLISFEGLPGAGKSTQAALLARCLTQHGLPTLTLPDLATLPTEPVAATLIDLLASSGDPYLRHGDAVTDSLLAAAIRAEILATLIDPVLDANPDTVLIEDRGIHTMQSYALAGLRRDHRASTDLAVTWVHTLAALTGQRAAHALWLRLPVTEALRRTSRRDQRSPTPEHRCYLHWVNQAYTELAQRDPQLTVLDVGTLDPTEVHHAVHLALPTLGVASTGPGATNPRCTGLPHLTGPPS